MVADIWGDTSKKAIVYVPEVPPTLSSRRAGLNGLGSACRGMLPSHDMHCTDEGFLIFTMEPRGSFARTACESFYQILQPKTILFIYTIGAHSYKFHLNELINQLSFSFCYNL